LFRGKIKYSWYEYFINIEESGKPLRKIGKPLKKAVEENRKAVEESGKPLKSLVSQMRLVVCLRTDFDMEI
jgi:hypothetical protein